MSLEDRVGQVEREQVRQGAELASLRGQVSEVGSDVKQLLAREAKRPGAPTLQTIALTCGGIGAIAGVVWWLIAQSPAVQDLTKRMDRLDDEKVGRVQALEKRMDVLGGWSPTRIVRAR